MPPKRNTSPKQQGVTANVNKSKKQASIQNSNNNQVLSSTTLSIQPKSTRKASSSSTSQSSCIIISNSGQSSNNSNKPSSSNDSKKRRDSTIESTPPTKKRNQPNNSILEEFLPILDNVKLNKCPPRPSSNISHEYGLKLARAYLAYVQELYDHFPDKFKNNEKRMETWKKFKNALHDGTFQYSNGFRDFVKNLSNHVAQSNEQRERANELERARKCTRRDEGLCGCGQPVCKENRDKCKECSKKSALQMSAKINKIRAEGVNCHFCLGHVKFKDDGTCPRCAVYISKRKQIAIHTFLSEVLERDDLSIKCNRCRIEMEHLHEVNAFTLHHVMYKDDDFTKTFRSTTKFIPEFKKFGADWFKKNEKLEVLCRPCHGLEHARNVEGGSNWQYCHEKMINLMGGKCQECGLSFESNSELGKIFHVHHKNRDGVKKRAQATEDIDDEEREIANNVNEYKLILAMTEEQQLEKLKEFELLCDGCHYFEHMEKHARSEVIDLGMKERMMNLLSFQRVLSMEK